MSGQAATTASGRGFSWHMSSAARATAKMVDWEQTLGIKVGGKEGSTYTNNIASLTRAHALARRDQFFILTENR